MGEEYVHLSSGISGFREVESAIEGHPKDSGRSTGSLSKSKSSFTPSCFSGEYGGPGNSSASGAGSPVDTQ